MIIKGEILSTRKVYNIHTIKFRFHVIIDGEKYFVVSPHKIRKLAIDRGVLLIFDECTSTFRETLDGLHKKIRGRA